MFSDAGNEAVFKIVECAKVVQLSWPVVEGMLRALSEDERFGEATDTAVREVVYKELMMELEQRDISYLYAYPRDDDGQPDESQEWHDYDADC